MSNKEKPYLSQNIQFSALWMPTIKIDINGVCD